MTEQLWTISIKCPADKVDCKFHLFTYKMIELTRSLEFSDMISYSPVQGAIIAQAEIARHLETLPKKVR